jgi:hypothetical protein
MYKKVIAKNGKEMFYRGNKLISRTEYESNTEEAQVVTLVEDAPEVAELEKTNSCIFCNRNGKFQRFASGTVVNMCEEHYNLKTLGEIVEQIR